MLTPNLYVKEREIVTTPSQTSPSTVVAMLPMKSGMSMQEVIINSADELISYFGEPSDYNYKEWFQVWNFLQYSSPITVIRVVDTTTSNRSTVGGLHFDVLVQVKPSGGDQ